MCGPTLTWAMFRCSSAGLKPARSELNAVGCRPRVDSDKLASERCHEHDAVDLAVDRQQQRRTSSIRLHRPICIRVATPTA
jgi:hypothetical protein